MKNKKMALLHSVIALLLCVSMLVGSTFAWFTDSVKTGINTIAAGVLDVELYHSNAAVQNEQVNANTKLFMDLQGSPILWEPGVVSFENLRVANAGDLALTYQLALATDNENYIIDGNNQYGLSQILQVGVVEGGITATDRAGVVGAVTEWTTLASFLRSGSLLAAGEETWGVVVYWQPGEDDNRWNLNNGKTLNEGETLQIDLGVKLVAAQGIHEADSFDKYYDESVSYVAATLDFSAATTIAPEKVSTEGTLTEAVTVGASGGQVYAEVPADVKLADGASALTLSVVTMEESQSNITASKRSEVVNSVDVHIDGVAEDNTVPMVIAINRLFPAGLNSNNVELYHVENGQTMQMTLVDNPVNHNEFSYDPLTGNAVIAIASFSEIVVVGDTASPWDGSVANGFNSGTGTKEDPFLIANAAQLAYFRNLVDAGNTFDDKFVKLTANINLNDKNFDPIGYGYEYDGFTADGATFNGTFDGGKYDSNGNLVGCHTIYGLYQNGWEANDCGKTYSYGMAGGGLFASVCDATIKNLNISGADIVMECIDMGVLAGYAQGNCTFDNIGIMNCTIQNYNRYTGGVVGECSPRYDVNGTVLHSNHVFSNIRVDSTTTVSSLWGSFDTSLGGILGGKWDKYGDVTKVSMTNCHVACTIDAFNDVTSAYQWYAYRRAGMLVGNTEQSANNKALANFLTCDKVYVYYGNWNDYHYCEFTNQSGSEDAAWQNNYPWVRIEEGLSCNPYSNPRYGHPIVNGTEIVDSIHTHQGDDECMVSLPFRQLYGGGQGVYGATEHGGVYDGSYTVTYIDNNELLKVEFVTDNSIVHELWDAEGVVVGDKNFQGWVDRNGEAVSGAIKAGNTKNYILYPNWAGEYTIRFLDAENNLLYYEFFIEKQNHTLNTEKVDEALVALQNKVDASGKVIQVSWNTDLSSINFKKATKDIVVKAVYNLSNSSITLEEVKDENDVIVAYKVKDANKTNENVNIVIPPYVGTIPIIEIKANAFAGFDNLHVVTIPTTVTYLGENAFASDWNNGTFGSDKGESMTIYYKGSYQEWVDKMTLLSGWSDGVSASTRIFFLNGTDTVDKSQGYLQFVVDDSNWLGAVKKGHFDYVSIVPDSFVSEYYKNCDCSVNGCKGNLRPDAHYWEALKTN